MRTYSSAQLASISRLFSNSIFRELASRGRSRRFPQLLRESELIERTVPGATVGDAFDAAFDVLKTPGRRDEYVYRAAVCQKVLLGKHSLRTATCLHEFRIGASKADLIILNGTATVYEIKSERDSLALLQKQIEDYRRVFAHINVVASEDHLRGIFEAVPSDVGVMCLTKRYQIRVEREAEDGAARICPVTLFESVRTAEAAEILRSMGVEVPDVPNTRRRTVMRELFAPLDPAVLHAETVKTLRRSRDLLPLGEFIGALPQSLKTAGLAVTMGRANRAKLIEVIQTPLEVAMGW